jgi:hypothetical protein
MVYSKEERKKYNDEVRARQKENKSIFNKMELVSLTEGSEDYLTSDSAKNTIRILNENRGPKRDWTSYELVFPDNKGNFLIAFWHAPIVKWALWPQIFSEADLKRRNRQIFFIRINKD